MKKLLAAILFIYCIADSILAQAASTTEANYYEERFRTLQSRVDNVAEGQRMLIQRLDRLDREISRLSLDMDRMRSQISQSGTGYATREELKRYAEKLKEIEEKRQADNAMVLKSIRELANAPLPAATSTPVKKNTPKPAKAAPENLVEYTVGKNESFSQIIEAYNAKLQSEGFKKISRQEVLAANPGLNPDKLRAGQRLKIPVPPQLIKN